MYNEISQNIVQTFSLKKLFNIAKYSYFLQNAFLVLHYSLTRLILKRFDRFMYVYIYVYICTYIYIYNYLFVYNVNLIFYLLNNTLLISLQNTTIYKKQLETYIQLESCKYCQTSNIVEPNNMMSNFGHQKVGFLNNCQKRQYLAPMIIQQLFFIYFLT